MTVEFTRLLWAGNTAVPFPYCGNTVSRKASLEDVVSLSLWTIAPFSLVSSPGSFSVPLIDHVWSPCYIGALHNSFCPDYPQTVLFLLFLLCVVLQTRLPFNDLQMTSLRSYNLPLPHGPQCFSTIIFLGQPSPSFQEYPRAPVPKQSITGLIPLPW